MRWAWGAFLGWGGGWVGCDEIAGLSGGGRIAGETGKRKR